MPDETIWDAKKGPKPYQEVEAEVQEAVVVEIDPDEETPPEPTFIVVRNAYGPGAHSVKFANGKPVGVWVREQEMTPEEVFAQLTAMGMDDDLVSFFTRHRELGIAADAELAADPAVAALAAREDEREGEKAEVRAAFIKAWKAKGSK